MIIFENLAATGSSSIGSYNNNVVIKLLFVRRVFSFFSLHLTQSLSLSLYLYVCNVKKKKNISYYYSYYFYFIVIVRITGDGGGDHRERRSLIDYTMPREWISCRAGSLSVGRPRTHTRLHTYYHHRYTLTIHSWNLQEIYFDEKSVYYNIIFSYISYYFIL